MPESAVKILLVEDNPGDARLVQEMLAEMEGSFTLEWVPRLADGLERLSKGEIDLVLLDLGLPDSKGIDTFFRAYAHAPETPFVLLTGLDDETLAVTAVRRGAQDYLLKGETDGATLLRSIRYATERKQVQQALRQAYDDLERRVEERTAELVQANRQLQDEIARRQQTEAALAASENRYRAIFENTGAATVIIGEDRTIRLVNSEFEKLSGCSREEIEGRKCFEHFVTAANVEKMREYHRLRRLDPDLAPRNYEFQFLDCHGREKEIFMTVAMIPGTRQSVASLVDITARKRAERALKIAHDNLELKVALRTAELAEIVEELSLTNEELQRQIAERQRAQAAVEAERQRLFALLDGLPTFVYLKTPDYQIRFANQRFRETFGNPEGKLCYEVFGSQEPCPDCFQGEVLKTRLPRQCDWTSPDGIRSYQLHHHPFADTDGSPLVLTLGIDITERKEAEEALRQSEARLAEAQRIAHLGHWEWNIETNESIWSEEIYRILDVPPQSKGPTYEEFLSHVHPEDREFLQRSVAEAFQGRPYSIDIRLLRSNGSVRVTHVEGKVILDESGRPLRMFGTCQDITARVEAEEQLRQSNERFRAIYEAAAIGISVADARGRILAANPALRRMLGYSAEELFAKSFIELTHPEDLPKNLKLFQELMAGKRDGFQLEKRYRRKNGDYFWGRVTTSTVKDTRGRPVYSIAMVEDITQARQGQQKLQESERNLRYLATQLLTAQERERQRIALDLHDDLGQSLMALKLHLRALEREVPAHLADLKQELTAEAASIDAITENVRRLARDLHPAMLEYLGLSAALNRLFKDFSEHHGIKLSLDLDDVNGVFYKKSQINIYRIFQECLTNIAKYSQATQVSIEIKKLEGRVSLRIEDNGRGFDAARVLAGRTARGLGLAAMEERMHMLGGSLEIWSRPGQGTRISFNIPLKEKK